MDLKVKLESFEGPLDLLLHLLEKNKVNPFHVHRRDHGTVYGVYP